VKKLLTTLGLLGALVGAPVGAPAPVSNAPGAISVKSAMPEKVRRGRRALQHALDIGGYVPLSGNSRGQDWVRARTHNFRRKGVGSRWRFTLRNGRR
jgi:hypothetical protein